MGPRGLILALLLFCSAAGAQELTPSRLGVLYNLDEAESLAIAQYYVLRRAIPGENLLGVHLGRDNVLSPAAFAAAREKALAALPTRVQSLALVWSRPFAVGCMSITSAFAGGYRKALCEPGCELTEPNPLFNVPDWLPVDTAGWWPAMLIPTADAALARALIDRGIAADGTSPVGVLYLVRTRDSARNVRSVAYEDIKAALAGRLRVQELATPVSRDIVDAIGYFTGVANVVELHRIRFLPGAVADHLTSVGGLIGGGGGQMSALAWLQQGATASYGTVSEPCNHLEKFPDIGTLMRHYQRGETILEAYWKSVAMPGQGLFIGEPLARPFSAHHP